MSGMPSAPAGCARAGMAPGKVFRSELNPAGFLHRAAAVSDAGGGRLPALAEGFHRRLSASFHPLGLGLVPALHGLAGRQKGFRCLPRNASRSPAELARGL
jgi:hypothetical protein